MATVTSFTSTRMKQIEDTTVVDGEIDISGNLVLKQRNGTPIYLGRVVGQDGVIGRDGVSVTRTLRYYRMTDNALIPAAPTTYPPDSNWTTTEPTYEEGEVQYLYLVDLTEFTSGAWMYSEVSISAAFEAAKAAYAKAVDAENNTGPKNTPLAPTNLEVTLNEGWWTADGLSKADVTFEWDAVTQERTPEGGLLPAEIAVYEIWSATSGDEFNQLGPRYRTVSEGSSRE